MNVHLSHSSLVRNVSKKTQDNRLHLLFGLAPFNHFREEIFREVPHHPAIRASRGLVQTTPRPLLIRPEPLASRLLSDLLFLRGPFFLLLLFEAELGFKLLTE